MSRVDSKSFMQQQDAGLQGKYLCLPGAAKLAVQPACEVDYSVIPEKRWVRD
jgi:hypothetical protein